MQNRTADSYYELCASCGHSHQWHLFGSRCRKTTRCECTQFAAATCEYTPDGGDWSEACGAPAIVRNPWLDADYDEWYCAKHADPAWAAVS